jgi:hypothetical protein
MAQFCEESLGLKNQPFPEDAIMKILFFILFFVPILAMAHERVTASDASPEQIFTGQAASPIFDSTKINFAKEWGQVQLVQEANGMTIDLRDAEINWPILNELNHAAALAWNAFLNCAQGNELAARELYLNINSCASASTQLQSLRAKVNAFANTAILTSNDRALNYGPLAKVPSFHPLLVQILLESTAIGYPFPFGDYDCPWGLFCGANKIIISHNFLNLASLFHFTKDEEEKNEAITTKVFTELLETGSLSGENAKYLTDSGLKKLRTSFAALKILQLLRLGRRDCGEFGLFPGATANFLIALQSHSRFTYSLRADPLLSLSQNLHTKMLESCQGVPSAIHWGKIGWGSSHRDPQTDYAWDLLSAAGAWRTLGER